MPGALDDVLTPVEEQDMKRPQYHFSKEDKARVVKIMRRFHTGKQRQHAVAAIKRSAPRVYGLLTTKMAKRWAREACSIKQKTGVRSARSSLMASWTRSLYV